ncbi:MAG: peptidylprolyl isomerase, partial [Clostridiaceae bacterium]
KHILVDNEELALNIKKEVAEGLSFEEAAKKYSSCPSKEKGGDLGEFPKGAMVKEFEDAAFTLPLGTVSEPVKTQFGFHLILVVDKNEGSMKEIEEVKGQIFEEMMQKKQSEKYLSYVEDLKSKYKAEVK